MIRPPRFTATSILGVACLGAALGLDCSSSGGNPSGTGGAQPTGGSGTGGTNPGTGGSAPNTGGTNPSGGSTTGGAGPATGGANPNSGGRGGANPSGGNPAGGSGQAGTSGSWSSAFPTFTKHSIATFSSGYSVGIADVDKDGKLDVIAVSSSSGGIAWFKGPTFTKYMVTTKAKTLLYMSPHDVDGDGDLDMALISDFSMSPTGGGGTISWAEAPADPTKDQEWELHKIDAIPTAHRVRWADLDGDGKKELLVLPLYGTDDKAPAKFTVYTIPADPKTGTWTSKVIDDKRLPVSHALEVVDWDGDKNQDLLTGSNDGVDLFRFPTNANGQRIGAGKDGTAPDKGSSEVGLGTLGGMRFLATVEPFHGTDVVVYTPPTGDGALWMRKSLGADLQHGHGMKVADFNGDGYDEIVAGGGEGDKVQLIYRYVPASSTWEKLPLDKGSVTVSGIDVGDLNGDGTTDIVTIGGNNLVWYENVRAK